MSTQTLENNDSSSNDTVSLETSDSSSITETVTEPEPAPEPKTKSAKAEKPKECTLHAKGEFVAGGRALLKIDKKSTLELSRTQRIVLERNGVEYHFKRVTV